MTTGVFFDILEQVKFNGRERNTRLYRERNFMATKKDAKELETPEVETPVVEETPVEAPEAEAEAPAEEAKVEA